MLHAVRHQEGGSRQDAADLAVVDELAREASAGAEEGVRRAAEMQAAGLRLVDQLAALLEIDGEGLFREDMLAGAQRRERDAEMGGRAR